MTIQLGAFCSKIRFRGLIHIPMLMTTQFVLSILMGWISLIVLPTLLRVLEIL